MKLKDGYMVRNVAGNYIVVAVGKEALDFNGVITINETGAFLWEKLMNETTEKDLLEALTEEYDVDVETATKDVAAFIQKLAEADLLV